MRTYRDWIEIEIALISVDQGIKHFVRTMLTDGVPAAVLPFLNLVAVTNETACCGLVQVSGASGLLLMLGGTALAILLNWAIYACRTVRGKVGGTLFAAGIVSNLLDRLWFGGATELFDQHAGTTHWLAFNFADVWMLAGAVMFVRAIIVPDHVSAQEKK